MQQNYRYTHKLGNLEFDVYTKYRFSTLTLHQLIM